VLVADADSPATAASDLQINEGFRREYAANAQRRQVIGSRV